MIQEILRLFRLEKKKAKMRRVTVRIVCSRDKVKSGQPLASVEATRHLLSDPFNHHNRHQE